MYAIVYLIFDLEIVLLYPYAVSTYENGLYGLVIMLIFTFIVTIGFVYELSSGALEIDSRQNSFAPSVDSKNPYLLLTSSFIPKGAHLWIGRAPIGGLASQEPSPRPFVSHSIYFCRSISICRSVSTVCSSTSNSSNFWRQVNSSNLSSKNNSFLIVNSLLKKYPNRDSVKSNLTVDHINSILSPIVPNFCLTSEQFNLLIALDPINLKLPIERSELKEILGSTASYKLGAPGAYRFIHKETQNSYVGSSISLIKRLSSGYFGSARGKRDIDVAIKQYGLANFFLEIYILPLEIGKENKLQIKNLVLSLEQILILFHNPEYNMLKVAGSSAGRVLTYEQKERNLKHLKTLNSKKEHKERLLKNNKYKSIKVKVFDTKSSSTTVYESISEASKALGLKLMTIWTALKVLKIKREQRLINNQYLITTEHLNFLNPINPSDIRRVVVLDTLINETKNFSSIKEAARFIPCADFTISNYLNRLKNKGVARLIKKRYMVYYEKSNKEDDSVESGVKPWNSNSQRVIVIDTLNGTEIVYLSIKESSLAIGCSDFTVRYALKALKEKGISRLIKGRYKVTTEDLKELKVIESISKQQRLEILDIKTNKIVNYPTAHEAALSLGCSESTISRARSHLNKTGLYKLVKGRYQIKPL